MRARGMLPTALLYRIIELAVLLWAFVMTRR